MRKTIISLILTVVCSVPGLCWGAYAHRTIAEIAQRHYTPATKAVLDAYLDLPSVEYASWPDRFRASTGYEHTTHWHMVAIGVDGEILPYGLPPEISGYYDGVACAALNSMIRDLYDWQNIPDSTVVANLRNIIHFMGDIHCPSHIFFGNAKKDLAQAKAINKFYVYFEGKPEQSYHSVWDNSLKCVRPGRQISEWVDILDTWDEARRMEACDTTLYGYILDNARRCFVINGLAKPGDRLGTAFLRQHEELITTQVQLGGYRLAHVLNSCFDPAYRKGLIYDPDLEFNPAAAPRIEVKSLSRANCGTTSSLGPNCIEGIILTDAGKLNLDQNPNLSWEHVDLGENLRTAYMLSGGKGYRLKFSTVYDNAVKAGMRVRIDLDKCSMDADGRTICGITSDCFNVIGTGEAPSPARKRLSELCEDDLYSLVEICGVEFADKSGALVNIMEQYGQRNLWNMTDAPKGWADGWASLLLDKSGRGIFMLLNSTPDWRRIDVRGVPKGVGNVRGILVRPEMRRYGPEMGEYAIRPIDYQDIDIDFKPSSSFRRLASWTFDNGSSAIAPADIRAEKGKGSLRCATGFRRSFDGEPNIRLANESSGSSMRPQSALAFRAPVSEFLRTPFMEVESSLAGLSGNHLLVNLCIGAGDCTPASSNGYPASWRMEYSTDGKKFIPAGQAFNIKPLYFPEGKTGEDKDVRALPSIEAALGFQQVCVELPAEIFGSERLIVRIVPVGNDAILPTRDGMGSIVAEGRKNLVMDGKCTIRIGSMEILYN